MERLLAVTSSVACRNATQRRLALGQVLIEGGEHGSFARMLAHDGYQVHQIPLPENLHDPRVSWRGYVMFGEHLSAKLDHACILLGQAHRWFAIADHIDDGRLKTILDGRRLVHGPVILRIVLTRCN